MLSQATPSMISELVLSAKKLQILSIASFVPTFKNAASLPTLTLPFIFTSLADPAAGISTVTLRV